MISETISFVSIVIALAALGVAVWQTRENSRLQDVINSSPIVVDIWDRWQTESFRQDVLVVVNEAPQTWPQEGIKGLSPDYRRSAYSVIYFFNQVGTLVVFNLVSEDLIVGVLGSWIVQTWRVLEPLIIKERELRAETYSADTPANFSDYYEHLAQRVLDLGGREAMNVIQRRVGLRHLSNPLSKLPIEPSAETRSLPSQ